MNEISTSSQMKIPGVDSSVGLVFFEGISRANAFKKSERYGDNES
jgi:hypothetical protein